MVMYVNPGPIEYEGVLERSDVVNASAYIPFPFDVKELFGVTGRVPVIARFDDVEYRGSLVSYGGPHRMLMLKEIREQLGKQPGDSVRVRIELDTAQRTVELAADVAQAFTTGGVTDTFRGFSYSAQREYNGWIEEAKRPQTRLSRIDKAVALLSEGKRLR